ELDRLFPDRAPIVDFAAIPPGAESVELVSRHLYEALKRGFEHPGFVALCHLNSERLLDAIRVILDRGALPLADEEVLADTYVRLHRQVRPGAASFEPTGGRRGGAEG